MIFITLRLSNYWLLEVANENEDAEEDEDVRSVRLPQDEIQDVTLQIDHIAINQDIRSVDVRFQIDDAAAETQDDSLQIVHTPNENQHGNLHQSGTDALSSLPDPLCKKVLTDWINVSEYFKECYIKYRKTGKAAIEINELFQTWFIVPWVIYFIACSLKTYNILHPWMNNSDSSVPQIYYLLYNVNQFVTLSIPYLCAKMINTYHRKHYKKMRKQQLEKFKDDPRRLSFSRQLLIKKEERYDFLPRIVGTSITINIGSPLYVFILFAGLFFSVIISLL